MTSNHKSILLFDVDGTLTQPRQKVSPEMKQFLSDLRKRTKIAIVGGSDIVKQKEQLGEDMVSEWDYVFSENGLVSYKNGVLVSKQNFAKWLGEEKLKKLVNFVLHYIADLDIPIKRGTFIEFRAGMLNVSPIGRNCSQEERDEFERYDHIHHVRETMIEKLKANFGDYHLKYSIGGQISFDVFPEGWDKTYCLPALQADCYDVIHFFGDKTSKGGNDYEIFESALTIGHTVTSPEDTRKQVEEVLAQLHNQNQN